MGKDAEFKTLKSVAHEFGADGILVVEDSLAVSARGETAYVRIRRGYRSRKDGGQVVWKNAVTIPRDAESRAWLAATLLDL
jgi:hypothetical protein